jgi:hypothetical protein
VRCLWHADRQVVEEEEVGDALALVAAAFPCGHRPPIGGGVALAQPAQQARRQPVDRPSAWSWRSEPIASPSQWADPPVGHAGGDAQAAPVAAPTDTKLRSASAR